MNAPTVRRDLSDYFRLVWKGKLIIAAATFTCVIVMGAFTWAMPNLYQVVAEVDAGVLAQVQPKELNLLVEAVDRNQFVVEGGLFHESTPKALTATFRPPWTIRLTTMTADGVHALRRLRVLTNALEAELNARYDAYAGGRARREAQARTLLKELSPRFLALHHRLEERVASAAATSGSAKVQARRAASLRASVQTAGQSRFRDRLLLHRSRMVKEKQVAEIIGAIDETLAALTPESDPLHPENTVAALERDNRRSEALARMRSTATVLTDQLSGIFLDISAAEGQVARANILYRAAERRRQLDERAFTALSRTDVTDETQTRQLHEALVTLQSFYNQADDPFAREIEDAAKAAGSLAKALQAGNSARSEPVLKPPAITTPPTLVEGPVYPRPLVNLAIAFLFGFVASVLFVVMTSQIREQRIP